MKLNFYHYLGGAWALSSGFQLYSAFNVAAGDPTNTSALLIGGLHLGLGGLYYWLGNRKNRTDARLEQRRALLANEEERDPMIERAIMDDSLRARFREIDLLQQDAPDDNARPQDGADQAQLEALPGQPAGTEAAANAAENRPAPPL